MVQSNRHREALSRARYSGKTTNKWRLWDTAFYSMSQCSEASNDSIWKAKLGSIASNQWKRIKTKSLAKGLKNSRSSKVDGATTQAMN